LDIKQGYTTMHGQPIIKFALFTRLYGDAPATKH